MEFQEIKQRIKDYFVEIKDDKFTKVKYVNCKHKIEWKGKELENKFMLTKNSQTNTLSFGLDYRQKDEIDSIFFTFTYVNTDGGYPGMANIKMYLIIDDVKNIELSDSSGFNHASQLSKVGDEYINIYVEKAQLSVSLSDFILICNAKKIEYSIRFGYGSLERVFSQDDLLIFKGFYNSTFDSDFELELFQNSNKIFPYNNFKNKSIDVDEIEQFIRILFEQHKNDFYPSKEIGYMYVTKSGSILIGRTAIQLINKGFLKFTSSSIISWDRIQFLYDKNDLYFKKFNFKFEKNDTLILEKIIKFSSEKFKK